jgi:hypothetical protein
VTMSTDPFAGTSDHPLGSQIPSQLIFAEPEEDIPPPYDSIIIGDAKVC